MKRHKSEVKKAGISVFVGVLLLFGAACHKKVPVAPPPAPAPAAVAPAPAPPPAKPSIGSFTAEPSRIGRGESATLRWSVTNATDVSIDGGVGTVQSSGSRSVTPTSSTTYTLTATGAGGSDNRSVTVAVNTPPPPAPPPQTTKPTAAQLLGSQVQDVYFDFDKFNIRPDAQQALKQDGMALKQILADYPGLQVVVEGHCDERGSAEYNVGLGDRRATAAKEFLVHLGVPADRLKVISYGKERPVCTEQTEECYQRNRDAHFSVGQ